MVRIACVIACLIFGFNVHALTFSGNVPDSTNDQNLTLQLTKARLKFQNENYQGAMRVYRDLYKNNPKHNLLNFRMGETFFMLGNYEKVIYHFQKVSPNTKDTEMMDYYWGVACQETNEFVEAKKHLKAYLKKADKKDIEYYDVKLHMAHVENAINYMADPIRLRITNLSGGINSEYVDAIPSITADQSKMIFTTRRPMSPSSKRDVNTGQYFDDVYIATRMPSGEWSEAEPIKEINTEWHDANTSISPDGTTIYLYKNIEGETLSGDIYISKFKNGTWTSPEPFPEDKGDGVPEKAWNGLKTVFVGEKFINSSYFETSACVTADNNSIYFVSERKKGMGRGDVYFSTRQGKSWSEPKNLGKKINTEYDEIGVYIHPDGNTMFYSSNGPKSMGGYDIFMVKKVNGRWQQPVNLGYPINTPDNEYHFSLTADSKTAYISSDRVGGKGAVDIYEVDMNAYFKERDLDFAQPELTVLKGTVIDENQKPVSANIEIRNVENDNVVSTIVSDENGKYFITLERGFTYELSINHQGMKAVNSKVVISKGSDAEKVKTFHFILNKQ